MTSVEGLLKLVGTPRDSALLRYLLAAEYLRVGDDANAVKHLRASIEKQPKDPLAWKALAGTLARGSSLNEALLAYRKGIAVAKEKGDRFLASEMEIASEVIERHGV